MCRTRGRPFWREYSECPLDSCGLLSFLCANRKGPMRGQAARERVLFVSSTLHALHGPAWSAERRGQLRGLRLPWPSSNVPSCGPAVRCTMMCFCLSCLAFKHRLFSGAVEGATLEGTLVTSGFCKGRGCDSGERKSSGRAPARVLWCPL